MNSDGTSQENLTSSSAEDSAPKYSANGKQMVFGSNRDGNYEIYRMSASGCTVTQLTSNTRFEDGVPSWQALP